MRMRESTEKGTKIYRERGRERGRERRQVDKESGLYVLRKGFLSVPI
jgi:hypothetical protein